MYPPQKSQVLIIDHDHTFLDQLSDRLLRMDLEVDFAESGRTAIQLVESESYDLIITEIAMPIFNGLEILRKAKEHNPSTPILVTSFSATMDWAEQAVREGAHTYLLRPLNDLNEFDRIVKQSLLNQKSSKASHFFQQRFSNNALDETHSTFGDIPLPTWESEGDIVPSSHKPGKQSQNQVPYPEGTIELNAQGQILSCDPAARNWLKLEGNSPNHPIKDYITSLADPSTPADVKIQLNGRFAQIHMKTTKDRSGSMRVILRIREIQNQAPLSMGAERNTSILDQYKTKKDSAVTFNSKLKKYNPDTSDRGWSPLVFIDQMKKSIQDEVEKIKGNGSFHIFEPQVEEIDPEVYETMSQRLSDISKGKRTTYH